ncbi:MAG: fatty acid desaturase family protein [Alphaproteobacteria bacterium]|nr:fatty acid desaturase family protein [Alphaproteobacteria bacterium]MBE8220191.1 fatty acid desaturase family protein [Alphaproteobacteria bacterium]
MIKKTAPSLPIKSLVDEATLAHIRQRSDFIGLALVAHAWGVIFLAMALFYYFPNPFTFLLAVALIGARQLGLAVLMHDAAHNALFRTLSWNNSVSDWLCAFPLMARTDAYRRYHLLHHFNTQQEDDPDLILSAPFPITRKSLWRKVIRDLSGQTAYHQRKAQLFNAWQGRTLQSRVENFGAKMKGAILTNAIIFASVALVFHWSFYFILWLLPFMTWHMLITRIRNIAEHAFVPDNNDSLRNARTTKAGWLMRSFLAPYWVNYHVEHHAIMHIPCYRLPFLHRSMIAQGLGVKMEIAANYWDVLNHAASRHNDDDKRGTIVHNGRKRRSRLAGNFSDGFSPQSR